MDQREATWGTEKFLASLGGEDHFHDYRGEELLSISLSGRSIGEVQISRLLELMECQLKYGDISQVVRPLIHVEWLRLDGSTITNDGLRRLADTLSKIRVLDLAGTQIDDNGLFHLRHLRDLTDLSIYGCRITGHGLEHLHEAQIQFLQLACSGVTDEGLVGLEKLIMLKELNLVGTKVTGSGFASLRKLKSLRRLALDATPLQDESVQFLTELSGLEWLTLGSTPITDNALPYLAKLTWLRELWVNETRISKRGYTELRKSLPRVKVKRPK